MKKQLLYSISSIAITAILMLFVFAGNSFEFAGTPKNITSNQPVLGLAYAGDMSKLTVTPVFPFFFVSLLYVIVQFFVISNIKVCYGNFKRIRVIIYILCSLITVPFILVPYCMEAFTKLLITGLNPFLQTIVYLPVAFQVWIWIEIMLRTRGRKIIKAGVDE